MNGNFEGTLYIITLIALILAVYIGTRKAIAWGDAQIARISKARKARQKARRKAQRARQNQRQRKAQPQIVALVTEEEYASGLTAQEEADVLNSPYIIDPALRYQHWEELAGSATTAPSVSTNPSPYEIDGVALSPFYAKIEAQKRGSGRGNS